MATESNTSSTGSTVTHSTIFIDLGKPLTPSVWNYTDEKEFNSVGKTNSVYRVLADKFLPMVADVINDEGSHYKYGGKEYFKLDKIFERQQVGEHNNIISILGNRGTGKSSILRSIPYLFDHKTGRIHSSITDLEKLKQFENCYFAPLQIIDPSAFKENDTLLEAFVSTLFTVFQTEIADGNKSNDNRKTDSEETRELIKAFKVTRQALQASRLESSKVLGDNINDTSYTDLQALEHLSSGTNLRKKLGYLVHSYIRWYFGNSKTNSSDNKFYLVLSIDDLDLFSGNVIQMLEDLRALIQIPGLIVTTALRYEQLMEEVEAFYIKRFKDLLCRCNEQGSGLSEDTNKMAQRYLIKLFPISKNIVAFDIKLGKNFKFIPAYPSNLKTQIDKDNYEQKNLPDFASCQTSQDYFVLLFFSRTGILLEPKIYNNEHPLMPRSYREFVQFTKYITAMPQVYRSKGEMYKNKNLDENTDGIDVTTLGKNLNQILEDWIPSFASANFSTPFRKFVMMVLDTPLEMRNKFIATNIINLVIRNYNSIDDVDLKVNSNPNEEIKKILSISNDSFYSPNTLPNKSNAKLTNKSTNVQNDDDNIEYFGFYRSVKASQSTKSSPSTLGIRLKLSDISSVSNVVDSISLGDIHVIFTKINNIYSSQKEVVQLISILKLVYSLELSLNKYNANNLLIISGGSFVNPYYLRILPIDENRYNRNTIFVDIDNFFNKIKGSEIENFEFENSISNGLELFFLSFTFGAYDYNFRNKGKLKLLETFENEEYFTYSVFQIIAGFLDFLHNHNSYNLDLSNLDEVKNEVRSNLKLKRIILRLLLNESDDNFLVKAKILSKSYGCLLLPINSFEYFEHCIFLISKDKNISKSSDSSVYKMWDFIKEYFFKDKNSNKEINEILDPLFDKNSEYYNMYQKLHEVNKELYKYTN